MKGKGIQEEGIFVTGRRMRDEGGKKLGKNTRNELEEGMEARTEGRKAGKSKEKKGKVR